MKRKWSVAGAVIAVVIVVAFATVFSPVGKEPFFDGLMLPAPLREGEGRPEHPAVRWLEGKWGNTLVPTEIQQGLTFQLREGARLPDGSAATPQFISGFLSRMRDRLMQNPVTRTLGMQATGEESSVMFLTRSGHEEFSLVIRQLLPNVLEDEPRQEFAFIMEAGDAATLPALKAQARTYREQFDLTVRGGQWGVQAMRRPGLVLRELSIPVVQNELQEKFLHAIPVKVGPSTNAAAFFTTDPPEGLARMPTGRKLLVTAVFDVRRLYLQSPGPRQRLVSGRDVSDLSLVVVCPEKDGPAFMEANRLALRWRKSGASVRVRRGEVPYDVRVQSVPEEFFTEPYEYWHSRGRRNRAAYTVAEVDGLIERLDEAVSEKGREKLVEEIRRRLKEDAVVMVLREKELFLCGRTEMIERIRKAVN